MSKILNSRAQCLRAFRAFFFFFLQLEFGSQHPSWTARHSLYLQLQGIWLSLSPDLQRFCTQKQNKINLQKRYSIPQDHLSCNILSAMYLIYDRLSKVLNLNCPRSKEGWADSQAWSHLLVHNGAFSLWPLMVQRIMEPSFLGTLIS